MRRITGKAINIVFDWKLVLNHHFQLGGGGSCKGDSGGPLMHFVSDGGEEPYYVQVGVVHGGIGECGSKDFPGIYARLEDEDNLNFIRQAIGLRESCTHYFS